MNEIRNCDTCGKEIDIQNSHKSFDKMGNRIIVCDECKKNIDNYGPPESINNYEDKFGNESYDDLYTQRPLGVTILAVLQIIGAIITFIIIFSLPSLFDSFEINNFFGIPLYELIIISGVITIPISIFLAFGLLNGEIWARKVTIIYQFVNIVTSMIEVNIIGIFIPLIIIFYLLSSNIAIFFKNEPRFGNLVKNLIALGVIVLIIIDLSTTLYLLSFRI